MSETLPTLPDGFTTSPLRPEYEQGAVDAINAAYSAITGGNATTLEDMRGEWSGEDFDQENNTCVVVAPDGSVAGYIDLWRGNALGVRWFTEVFVHPRYAGRGIDAYLLQWAIQGTRRKVDQAPEGARVVLHHHTNSANEAARALLEQAGFQIVRRSYRMRIDLDTPPIPAQIPEGISIRPFRPGEERALLYADFEAFKDHWGRSDDPFDEFFKHWDHYMQTDPLFDPALWFVAVDGDEVAGVSLCTPMIYEDPGMGWVNSLAVRRPWRKHGLGLALLQHSFGEFYRRGKPRAGLGVDAENLTGALRLYEKAGMRIWRSFCTYELELRPGQNLLRTQLEGGE